MHGQITAEELELLSALVDLKRSGFVEVEVGDDDVPRFRPTDRARELQEADDGDA